MCPDPAAILAAGYVIGVLITGLTAAVAIVIYKCAEGRPSS